MSAALITLIAVAISLAGIGLLARCDPKRRRAAGLGPADAKQRQKALALVFAPVLLLAIVGQTSPFVLWIAIVSVAGWIIAMRRPASF